MKLHKWVMDIIVAGLNGIGMALSIWIDTPLSKELAVIFGIGYIGMLVYAIKERNDVV